VLSLDLQIDGAHPQLEALRTRPGHQRVIFYSHTTTDEVILTSLDMSAGELPGDVRRQPHLIDAIHAVDRPAHS